MAIIKKITDPVRKRGEDLRIGDIVELKQQNLGTRGVVISLVNNISVYVKWPSGLYSVESNCDLKKVSYVK